MAEKQYVLFVGKPDGNDLRSIFIDWKRIALMICSFILLLAGLSILFGKGIQKLKNNYRTQKIEYENRILRSTVESWEKRFRGLETSVADLSKRNRQIRLTAALSSPDVEIGIGGPESGQRPGLMNIPKLHDLELNLAKIESEMSWLKQSTNEIEDKLESKFKEIAHYPSIRPVQGGWVTSVFGVRKDPFTGIDEMHPGLDISIRPGSEVRAAGAGVVKRINTRVIKNKGYGKLIEIDHGFGYKTLYAHLSEIYVESGQAVKRWDLIGLTGDTGKSTAPHLHYGVYVNGQAMDPVNFILK